MRRATIEIEYIDGSLKVIAKDSYVTDRLINIMDKLAKRNLKNTINNIMFAYCDDYQVQIISKIYTNNKLLNP